MNIIWKYRRFGKIQFVVISGLNNEILFNMFKMIQMLSYRYCSNFYDIGDYNTIRMCNTFMFDDGYEVKAYAKKFKGVLI